MHHTHTDFMLTFIEKYLVFNLQIMYSSVKHLLILKGSHNFLTFLQPI